MNISQALNYNYLLLANNKIPNSHLDAEILLSFVFKKTRGYLLARSEKKLTESQIKKFSLIIKKRIQGIPVAYLTGQKSFYGLDFILNKNVLIPRPETEMMVDEVLSHVTQHAAHSIYKLSIIDVGTGSGCIIISLVKKLSFGYPKLSFCAIDISKSALSIARKNARLHKVDKKIKFLRGNLLEPIFNPRFAIRDSQLIITANLPYLTPKQFKNSPTIKHEPKLALSAGSDGLKYYRKLFRQIKKLPTTYCRLTILCEIDPDQSDKIKKLAQSELKNFKYSFKNDLSGRKRLFVADLSVKNNLYG